MAAVSANVPKRGKPDWVPLIAKYNTPKLSVSAWQVCNSFGPYIALWILMYFSLSVSYWLTLALAVVASGFLMRIFVIQHDCGHNSFFKSRKLNDAVGFACGVLTFTPYEFWRTGHARHHATSSDLDNRGWGDVQTRTVKEYLAFSPKQRLFYRLYRNPFLMFGFAPLYMFVVNQRTPLSWKYATTKKARRGLIYTDIALLSITIILSLVFGFKNYLLIQFPIALLSSTLGVWLFYVQHQFEDTYWRPHVEWDFTKAALQGSSYYKLPKIFQWFTGNIGLHHIHHLSPKIPNYLLEKCHDENPAFQNVPTLTLKTSWIVVSSCLALWDDDQDKLISFKEAHEHYLAD